VLLDENVEHDVRYQPEHYGHDVVHVDFVSEFEKGYNNGSLASYTRSENRILLTYDDDFVLSLDESDLRAVFYEALEDVREAERVDRSTAIARLLGRGIEAWRVDTAVNQYRDGEVSLGKAAEIADISVWTFLDVLDGRDVGVGYGESDLEADQ
jgi:predicted HTH domain antitoxin